MQYKVKAMKTHLSDRIFDNLGDILHRRCYGHSRLRVTYDLLAKTLRRLEFVHHGR